MRIIFPKEMPSVNTMKTTLLIHVGVNTLSCTVIYHVHLNLADRYKSLMADGSGDQCVFTVCVCQAKSLFQQIDQEINVCSLFVFVRPRASFSR